MGLRHSATMTYPLLKEILTLKNLELTATFSIRISTILASRARHPESRGIRTTPIPGSARPIAVLPTDLEAFIASSRKGKERHAR